MNETTERLNYRWKCKHFLPYSEGCALHSQGGNGWHFLARCTGDCRRMKNYDRKVKEE